MPKKSTKALVQTFHILPPGLPDSLLRIEKRVPRIFSRIPNLNREARRAFISGFIKRDDVARRDLKDQELLTLFFSNPDLRRSMLAAFYKNIFLGKKWSWPLPIEIALLRQLFDNEDALTTFDPAKFQDECGGWVEVQNGLEGIRRLLPSECQNNLLRWLTLWPYVQRRLESHTEDSDPELEELSEIIFAFSSLTNSPFFLNTAFLLLPSLSTNFSLMLDTQSKELERAGKPDLSSKNTGTVNLNEAPDFETGDQKDRSNKKKAGQSKANLPDAKLPVESNGVINEGDSLATRAMELATFLQLPEIEWEQADVFKHKQLLEDIGEVLAKHDQHRQMRALYRAEIQHLREMSSKFREQSALSPFLDAFINAVTKIESAKIELPRPFCEELNNYRGELNKRVEEVVRASSDLEGVEETLASMVAESSAKPLDFALRRQVTEHRSKHAECDLALVFAQERLQSLLGPEGLTWISEIDSEDQALPNPGATSEVKGKTELHGTEDAYQVLGIVATKVEDSNQKTPEQSVDAQNTIIENKTSDVLASLASVNFEESRVDQKYREPELPVSESATVATMAEAKDVASGGRENSKLSVDRIDTPECSPGSRFKEALSRALVASDRATAYQLAMLADAHGHPWIAAIRPLLKALALSPRLIDPMGELATEIGDALAIVEPEEFSGNEQEINAQNLILLAAILRPLLLAPDSTAASLSRRIRLPSGMGQLYEWYTRFCDSADKLRHRRLGAVAFAAIRDEQVWRDEIQTLEEEIKLWVARADKVNIKYHAGTKIWKEILKESGELGKLLGPIVREGSDRLLKVRTQYDEIEGYEGFQQIIDDATRGQKLRIQRIHGAALEQLRGHYNEAIRLAERWLILSEAKKDFAGQVVRQLDSVKGLLDEYQDSVESELRSLRGYGDCFLAAAADVVQETLTNIRRLFNPINGMVERAPSTSHYLNRPLLASPELQLSYNWVIESSTCPPEEALARNIGIPNSLAAALTERLNRADIVGAQRIIELLDDEDPESAAAGRGRLEPLLLDYWESLDQELTAVQEKITYSVVYGLVTDKDREQFEAQLNQLNLEQRDLSHAPKIQEVLDTIRVDLNKIHADRQVQNKATLERLRSKADPADLKMVEHAIETEDLPTANEYLSRLSAGEKIIPYESISKDRFNDLYRTSLCSKIEEALGKKDGINRLLTSLERAATFGPFDFGAMPEAVRKDSLKMARQWSDIHKALGAGAAVGSRDRAEKSLRALLGLLGFTGVMPIQFKQTRIDILESTFECDTISDRSVCPLPYFGSRARGRYRVICVTERSSADLVVRALGNTINNRPAIILFFGMMSDRLRRDFAIESRKRRAPFILLDQVVLTYLAADGGSRLTTLFGITLPLAFGDPYSTTAGEVTPELFFGRQDELRRLQDPNGPCFVYGGRQLGKTALLKQVERQFRNEEQERFCSYLDLKASHIGYLQDKPPAEIWSVIIKTLANTAIFGGEQQAFFSKSGSLARPEALVEYLEGFFLKFPNRHLLLLLDEADKFLVEDARDDYIQTIRLKGLMERTERRFKVVFAGLHNVLRTAEQANHPLAHFGEPIKIGPLINHAEWRAARELVQLPMAAAGFEFESNTMVDRILSQTNFYPSLIQLYCAKLIEGMMLEFRVHEFPRFAIRGSRLDETYARDFRAAIRDKFRLTLQLDNRYELIAYVIAYESYQRNGRRAGTFSSQDLATSARDWWADGFASTADHEFRVILDEMIGLGILRGTEDGRYTLRNSNLLLLMGTKEEVEQVLLSDRDLPEQFVAEEIHPVLQGSDGISGRHPLSFSQIASLLANRREVAIIAGTPACGIDKVCTALGRNPGPNLVTQTESFSSERELERCLRDLVVTKTDRQHVFVVHPDSPWTDRWVETAIRISRERGKAKHEHKVVFILSPDASERLTLNLLREDLGIAWYTLRPWTAGFIKQWLEDLERPSGPLQRESLMKKSGFWPLLLDESENKSLPISITTFCGNCLPLVRILSVLVNYAPNDKAASFDINDISELAEMPPQDVSKTLWLGVRTGTVREGPSDMFSVEPKLRTLITEGRVTVA